MIKVEAIVLAYRWAIQTGSEKMYSAMQLIHGKPILEWTIDALHGCSYIDKISVIGPDELDNLLCMRYVDRRLAPASITFEKMFKAISSDQESNSSQTGFLLLPCEEILITSSLLDQLLFQFEKDTHELFLPVVRGSESQKPVNFNFQEILADNQKVLPGYITIARTIRFLPAALSILNDYHPQDGLLDNSGITISFLTAVINQNKLSGISTRYYECEDQAFVIAAVNGENLNYADRILPYPYTPSFSRVKIILNPGSGKSPRFPKFLKKIIGIKQDSTKSFSSEQYTERILHALEQMGIKAEITKSKSPQHATEIARSCTTEGYDLVIAAGGDGTINSVVNGLAGSTTALGVIPLGTINLFAMELDIPIGIESACQIIGRGNTRTIDLGKVNNRFFTSLCGIGFDAYVITQTGSALKNKIGAIAYILNGIKNLIRYQFHSIRLSIDQQPTETGYIAIIGNGKHYSASILIASEASLDDGLLDIVLFKKRDALSLLRYVWDLQRGDLTALPEVKYFRGKHITVERHGHHKLHIDGEYFGRTPVEISIVPSALKVVC